MRLLFVHERFGALGGAEANILATASELKRRGHVPGLLHGAATGREEAAWYETFRDLHPLPGREGPGALDGRHALAGGAVSSASRSGMLRAVAQFRPDVIFLHKLANLELQEALATSGAPVVRMVHDHDLYCLRGYKYNPLSRRICTRAASAYCVFPCGGTVARKSGGGFPFTWVSYAARQRELALNRRFSRLIVATGFMKHELERNRINPAQIEVHAPVPRAADTTFQCSFDARNRLVFAGQIIRGKGVDVLLESLARVRVPFECEILGDGSHRPHCERLCRRLGLAHRVHFAGFVPQARIAEYYRDASLAVMSSLWPEPFGAVGLEAMRCGLPVVAFDAGGIREWLIDGWNGCLIPWMDRARYAAAITKLLQDKPLARTLGEQGRQWVGERFGFSEYISGLEDLFARVSAECRPAPAPAGAQNSSPGWAGTLPGSPPHGTESTTTAGEHRKAPAELSSKP